MAYVFGIDIPMTELLIIVIVLVFAGHILNFLEFRKLRKLITTEKGDILRLELDLSHLEGSKYSQKPGEAPPEKVVNFVKDAIRRGYTQGNIESVMLKSGWSKEIIMKVFESFGFKKKEGKHQTKPKKVDDGKFEASISKLPIYKGKEPPKDTITFVRTYLMQGYTRDRIHNALKKSGWDEETIAEIFRQSG